jgi:hypothetical protein
MPEVGGTAPDLSTHTVDLQAVVDEMRGSKVGTSADGKMRGPYDLGHVGANEQLGKSST